MLYRDWPTDGHSLTADRISQRGSRRSRLCDAAISPAWIRIHHDSIAASARPLIALSALALAACRVGPNYHPPTPPPGTQASLVSMDGSAQSPGPLPDAWWRLYNDPRLDALVQEALNANRKLAAANANLAAARSVLSLAKTNRYPSTTASAGGLYGRDAVTDEILEWRTSPQTIWLLEDVIQAAYEVDLFGRVRRAIEVANANADAVAAARDGVRVVVVAQAAHAYAAICAWESSWRCRTIRSRS